MAIDSIIARPTNRVLVIVEEASGCWASALNAAATARPWPIPGPTAPIPIVRPAERIDAAAMIVILSMFCLSLGFFKSALGISFVANSRRDVNQGQDAKNIGLDHSG